MQRKESCPFISHVKNTYMKHALDQTLADIKELKLQPPESRPSEEFLNGCEYAVNTLILYLSSDGSHHDEQSEGVPVEQACPTGEVQASILTDGSEQGKANSKGREEAEASESKA